MEKTKLLWSKLCLINLAIVALLGFTLRSKILFPIRFIDYRSFLSAHSHFAFSGWVGLAITFLLIYNMLPEQLSSQKKYQWILGLMEVSSLGMAVSFPLQGYGFWSILFSSSFIIVNYVFAFIFIKDILKSGTGKTVKMLSISAIVFQLVSAIGPLGLVYILLSGNGDSILYRDSIYTFLHFQYNGFFTLSVFALFFRFVEKKGIPLNKQLKTFAWILAASVVPALFLSLLWHNKTLYYILGISGFILLLLTLFYFISGISKIDRRNIYSIRLASMLLTLSFVSFSIKMLLNAGTIIPSLGNAVYGDRPVIIGFLHLVFLAFVSFFILSQLLEENVFTRKGRIARTPLVIFMTGVVFNETILMIQGFGILLMTNSEIYSWLLWFAAILLLAGSSSIAFTACQQKSHPDLQDGSKPIVT